MLITRTKLKNWRNFRNGEAMLGDVTYVVGANASGKSNFLDVFRFLRDIAKPDGGGLQKAISDRGGLSKLRCLHARRDPEVLIEIEVSEKLGDAAPKWRYVLGIKSEGVGKQRPVVSREEVYGLGHDQPVLCRPSHDDASDPDLLTQTALEQIQTNKAFRELVEHFAYTTYLHVVPQLIKFGDSIGGRQLESDPFGQAFLDRIAKTPEKTREIRLKRIQQALAKAIPQFEVIRFIRDEISGRPHLEANYAHYRANGSWQREDQFSDGTLRLIALFWILLDGKSTLLLEEPELSLDEEIVRQLPRMIEKIRRSKKHRQIIISTHSRALLEEKAIDARFILRLEPDAEGTRIEMPSSDEKALIRSGFSAAEAIMAKVHPKQAIQMDLF